MADSESIAVPAAVKLVRETYGAPVTVEHWLANYHGLAGQPLLDKIKTDFGVHIDWTEFMARRRATFASDYAHGVDSAAGALNTINTLHTAGQTMCICSNSMADRIGYTLTAMHGQAEAGIDLPQLFAGHIFAAVDNPLLNPKPAPDVYLAAAHVYGAAPHRCVAVEDSPTGAKSALAAGFVTVGYVGLAKHPQMEATKLAELGVSHIMEHWDEFIPLVASLAI